MISSALIVIDISSSLIIALGVLAVWQKNRLIRLGGMRGNINKLRSVSRLYFLVLTNSGRSIKLTLCSHSILLQMVNEMTVENDKLTSSNDELEKQNGE